MDRRRIRVRVQRLDPNPSLDPWSVVIGLIVLILVLINYSIH